MANNLRKFDTYAEYSAATLVKPAVSLIEETDGVIFDPKDEAPMLGDIRLTFNISDTVNETLIYNTGGASEGGASEGGEDSEGSGGSFAPSAMWVDGVSVTPINSYRFLTAGLHTVDLELSDGEMPENLLGYVEMVKLEIGNGVTTIEADACSYCYSLTSCTIGKVIDFYQDDANDLPRSMAPACADTIIEHLIDLNVSILLSSWLKALTTLSPPIYSSR